MGQGVERSSRGLIRDTPAFERKNLSKPQSRDLNPPNTKEYYTLDTVSHPLTWAVLRLQLVSFAFVPQQYHLAIHKCDVSGWLAFGV